MKFKDLKLREKIFLILLLIVSLPIILIAIIFGLIIMFVTVPIEYPKYKKSRYYKKFKQKYSIGITNNTSYKLINYLEEENIKYDSYDIEKDELKIGKITYLFPWFECITFDKDGNCIIAEQDGFEYTLLTEDEKVRNRKNIKIIIDDEYFSENDLINARNCKKLLVYNEIPDIVKELK